METAEKKVVELQDAIKEFVEMFQAKELSDKLPNTELDYNFYQDRKFYIDKRKVDRNEVFNRVSKWFEENVIKDHYVEFTPITLLWTTFKIKNYHE